MNASTPWTSTHPDRRSLFAIDHYRAQLADGKNRAAAAVLRGWIAEEEAKLFQSWQLRRAGRTA